MTNSEKPKTGEQQNAQVEIVTGPEACAALSTEALQQLIRNHAKGTLTKPKLTPDMSHQQVQEALDMYGYPREILRNQSAWNIGSLMQGCINRMRGVTSPVYDADAFEEIVAAHHGNQEEQNFNDVVEMSKAGNMVVAKVNGEVAGMLGIRKLGLVGGRQLYEHVKASVLPEYGGKGIFHQLKARALESIFQECPNPLLLVHTRTPTVRHWAESRKHKRISFEEYMERHETWKLSPDRLESLKKKWEIEGWDYFEVDLASENLPKNT